MNAKGWPDSGQTILAIIPVRSLDDLGDDACTDGATTLTDGKAHAHFHGDWADQFASHLDVVSGHHHFHVAAIFSGECGDLTGHVRGADVELRAVASEERGMATTFFFF